MNTASCIRASAGFTPGPKVILLLVEMAGLAVVERLGRPPGELNGTKPQRHSSTNSQ